MMKHVADTAFRSFMTSSFVKRRLGTMIRFFTTIIVRSVLSFIVSGLIATHVWFLNYIVQMMVGIAMFFATDLIYSALFEFQEDFDQIALYFVKNYSDANVRVWKRYAAMCMCTYAIILCSLFSFDPKSTTLYCIQFLVCYAITDEIENRDGPLLRFGNRVYDMTYSKLRTKTFEHPIMIVEDYEPHGNPHDSVSTDSIVNIINFDDDFVFSDVKIKKD